MVVEGDQVMIGDVTEVADLSLTAEQPVIAYEVLCRRHHRRRLTRAAARAALAEPLPFDTAEEEPA
jgi:thymidine kinase